MKLSISPKTEIFIWSLFIFCFYSFVLWGIWPGIVQTELLQALPALTSGIPSKWATYTYSYIFMFFYKISPTVYMPLTILNIGWAAIFFGFFNFLHKQKKLRLIFIRLFALSFCFSPYLVYHNLLLYRDVYCAFLHVLLITYFIVRHQKKCPLSPFPVAESMLLGALVTLAATITQDSLLLLFVFPFVIYKNIPFSKKEWAACLSTTLFIFTSLTYIIPTINKDTQLDHRYTLSPFYNPLAEIIHKDKETTLTKEERIVLNTYFDVPWMKSNFNFYETPSIVVNDIDSNKVNEIWPELKKISFKLIILNFDTFLLNRIRMMSSQLGLIKNTIRYEDCISDLEQDPGLLKNANRLNISPRSKREWRVSMFYHLYRKLHEYTTSRVLVTALPALLMALLILLRWGSNPISLWALLLVWHRFIFIFLLAPSDSPKYLHSIAIGTFFIFVFSFTEKAYKFFPENNIIQERRGIYFGSFLLASFFAWLFSVNFNFLSSYDFLILKDPDDIIFHQSLQRMQHLLLDGDFLSYFSYNPFGYGSIYWIPMSLITWPTTALDLTSLNIFIPKFVSWVSYLLTFIAFYKIAHSLKYERYHIVMGLVLMTTFSIPYLAATQFHNHTVIAALILWAFYFLLNNDRSRLAILLLGFAIGLKVVSIIVVPIFIILFNRHRIKKFSDVWAIRLILQNIAFIGILFLIAIISYSPGITLWGYTDYNINKSFDIIHYLLFKRDLNRIPMDFLQHLQTDFLIYYFTDIVFIFGVLGCLGIILFSKLKDSKLVCYITLLSFSLILLFNYLTRYNNYGFRFYIIPLAVIYTFSFVEISQRLKKHYLLPLLVLVNFYFNYSWISSNFVGVQNNKNTARFQEQVERYKTYEKLDLVRQEDNVFIDFDVLYPLHLDKKIKDVYYAFDRDPIRGYDLFIFNKKTNFIHRPCDPEDDACMDYKNAAQGLSPYKQIFEDEFIRIVRLENYVAP